ncbi:hypothetical protein [Saccharothrix texasensis]|uniref:Uncharacterized protein n=1 Tax=Saccharothrix texasensis TaxID=103734 RepID=A0A3N1HBD2_9PSEU|nr:hypothetical protein [Saccharothrix texasensis]ROP39817.1 hypothetical protein EDD40_5216 [Saccharothrix texasensis]
MDLNGFSPDGLTEDAIDALIRDVADELADESAELAAAMLALVDGPTRNRAVRRTTDRKLDSIVRVLRVHGSVIDTAVTEAA